MRPRTSFGFGLEFSTELRKLRPNSFSNSVLLSPFLLPRRGFRNHPFPQFVSHPGEPTTAAASLVGSLCRRSLIMASGEGWEAAVRAEVGAGWWDDPDGDDLRARFKAFTGQRGDWPQPKLLLWKDLILRVARRLRLCSAPAQLVSTPPAASSAPTHLSLKLRPKFACSLSLTRRWWQPQVTSVWFALPGGLTPLCLPQVLVCSTPISSQCCYCSNQETIFL
jgi:hypothetical protein